MRHVDEYETAMNSPALNEYQVELDHQDEVAGLAEAIPGEDERVEFMAAYSEEHHAAMQSRISELEKQLTIKNARLQAMENRKFDKLADETLGTMNAFVSIAGLTMIIVIVWLLFFT